jgi:hypothetical protein
MICIHTLATFVPGAQRNVEIVFACSLKLVTFSFELVSHFALLSSGFLLRKMVQCTMNSRL